MYMPQFRMHCLGALLVLCISFYEVLNKREITKVHIVSSLPLFLSSLHLLPTKHSLLSVSFPSILSFFFMSLSLSLSLFPLPFPLSCLQGDLSQTSVVLEGHIERGRFGTSVVNLGDIDDDSYEGL